MGKEISHFIIHFLIFHVLTDHSAQTVPLVSLK